MKNKFLSLAALLAFTVTVNANILPDAKQFQFGIGASSYNETKLNLGSIEKEFTTKASPTIGYGFTNWLSASYNYSSYDVKNGTVNGEFKEHQVNLNWNAIELPMFRITSSAGLSFIEQNSEAATALNNVEGTALNFNGTAYLTMYPFVSPYASLGILGNPNDEEIYEDTLTEHIGFVVSPNTMLDIVADYEFSYKALSYGLRVFF